MVLKPLASMTRSQGETLRFLGVAAEWDGVELQLKNAAVVPQEAHHTADGDTTDDVVSRVKKIIDAKCEKADVAELCRHQVELNAVEQDGTAAAEMLPCEYKKLIDGQLGHWQGQEAKVELKKVCLQHTTMLCADTESQGQMSCCQNECSEDS